MDVIRQAERHDLAMISSILHEAAAWLREREMPLWWDDELLVEVIEPDIVAGLFFIAERDGEPAGTMKLQFSDAETWPDVPEGESTFVHRLAVRRRFAGGAVSAAMLRWAVRHARQSGREYLRLDCEARRPKLKAIYERFGFRHHSDFQLGPYFLARYELRTTRCPQEKIEEPDHL